MSPGVLLRHVAGDGGADDEASRVIWRVLPPDVDCRAERHSDVATALGMAAKQNMGFSIL